MSCNYISSNNNRFYVAPEPSYGNVGALSAFKRISAVSLKARRQREHLSRRDKTGTRTFLGVPGDVKHQTTYELSSYMTGWTDQANPPVHSTLIEALMGGAGKRFAGAQVASAVGTRIATVAAHGLAPGQAVACNGELRFVTNIADALTVFVNAPFTTGASAGSILKPTYSFSPAGGCLRSVSIMDCWSPATAVNRILCGAAVDRLHLEVNGDFHEFRFGGMAADLLDSATFETGEAGLEQFPAEPDQLFFDYTLIPGHLGQAWIGSVANRVFTLASARLTVDNNVELRARAFGSSLPRGIAAGDREVRLDFSLYAQADEDTKALYQAARQRSPIGVMLQLGQQNGQLCGVFMKSVVAETPEFDDSEPRLVWNFQNCRAQGSGDDEIVVAFA
jgi:hypothetical protein